MPGIRGLVPNVIRRNYAVKFGIALLVLGLSVGLVGFVGTALIQEDVEQRTDEDYATLAAQEAEKLETWNDNNELTVDMLSRSAPVASGDAERIQSAISSRLLELPVGAQAIHYVNVSTGEVVASTTDGAVGRDLSSIDEPWTETAANPAASVTVSEPYERTLGDVALPLVAYTKQVHEDSNHAIVYTVNMHAYAVNLQSTTRSGVTMVVDGNDRVMADEYNGELLASYDNGGPLAQARSGGPTNPGTTTVASAGLLGSQSYPLPTSERAVVGFAQVRNTDWVVLVHTPESAAYGFVQRVRDYGAAATLVGVLLVGLVGAVLGRNTAVAIDRLTAKTEAMEDGDLDVDLSTRRIDNIGRLYDGFDNMRESLKTTLTEAETARENAEAARERTQRVNEHLEAKAAEYGRVMESVADGDLTERMDADADNEAMADIAEAFNEMIVDLERTTAEVKAFAEDVATASEEVTASSEEVRSASQQVTESIQEISDGTDRQSESLQVMNQEMNDLSTTTEEIAASSNQVADVAERTAEAGKQGREAAQEAIEGMEAIETESDEAVAEIERLEEEIAKVDELLGFIQDVAKETNMLALNANIEASRGGAEAGGDDAGGFAVVAQEVKQLAADTKDAAEDIEARLDSIQAQTGSAVETVHGTRERVAANKDAVAEAVGALEDIADYTEETNTGVQEISAASQEQAASTDQAVAMVDDVATIGEETSAEAENVAAAAEEQTTALTEVSQSASTLAEQAGQLSAALDQFETARDGDGSVGSSAPASDAGEDPEASVLDGSDDPETNLLDGGDDPSTAPDGGPSGFGGEDDA